MIATHDIPTDVVMADHREMIKGMGDKEAIESLCLILDGLFDPTLDDVWEYITTYGMTTLEAKLVHALRSRPGRTISKEGLVAIIYSDRIDSEWPAVKIIDVFVCKVRKKLRDGGADFEIETVWGMGYRAVTASDEALLASMAEEEATDAAAQ